MANEQEASILLFDSLCDEMFKQQRLSNSDHEDAKSQYSTFLKTVVRKNEDEFSNFDYTKDRLGKFLGKFLIGAVKYCILWEVCKFVFILSHGQASIERGFNVNKDTLAENLEQLSLVSQRLVYDNIKVKKIYEVEIPRAMVLSCKAASSKYRAHLAGKDKEKVDTEQSRKRVLMSEEISQVKRKKVETENVITSMRKDIDEISRKAVLKETFKEMKLDLEKANYFRDAVKSKEGLVTEFDQAVLQLEKEMKKQQ